MSVTNIFFDKVTILGVGLMGASFALALKKHGLCKHVVGNGRNPENLKRAKESGIIDSFEPDPGRACEGSDIVLLATPVGTSVDITKKISRFLKKGAIVTDVGSVKGKLVYDMEALMPEGVYFVGGHPIAGSSRSGIETASADIFKGAQCILTPTDKTSKDALEGLIHLWRTIGSHVELTSPEEHDRIYAAVSHLPHLLTYAIVNTVADIDSSYFKYVGKGFITTTRIAASSPELWRDICILNKDNLLEYLEVFKKNLEKLSQYLKASDNDSLEREFKKARALREGIG